MDLCKYFLELKKRIGIVKVFVTDRCMAQIEALKKTLPETCIIFSSIHIERNISNDINRNMLYAY